MSDRDHMQAIVDGLVEHGKAIAKLVQPGDGAYHLNTLLKVHDWAVAQQPYKVGDRVQVNVGPFKVTHGFSPWNHVWIDRPLADVIAVEYNGSHDYWAFLVRVDGIPDKSFNFSAESLSVPRPNDEVETW